MIPRLLQVPGVADVAPFGGLVKQYQIEVDPLALDKYRLSIKQIADAVSANNQNAGGALLDNRQQALVIRGVGLIQSVGDIENIVLDASNGVPVFVRDIGRVNIGAAPQTGIFGVNDQSGECQTGVEGIVLMRRWENPSEVLKDVKAAVEELNNGRLPAGVKIVPIYDRTDLVSNTLRTVSRTLRRGAGDRDRGAAALPRQRAGGAADGGDHPALAAVRLHLHVPGRDSGQPAQPRRARFRHHRRRHAGDGGAHRPPPGGARRREGGLGDALRAVQAAALEVARRSSSRWLSSSRPTSRSSRWSASSGGCSRRWPSRCASALLGSLLLSLTLIPVLAT